MDRQELMNKLQQLIKTHNEKQKKYQEENNLGPEVGCITRESCEIMSLLPQMRRLDVTLDDVLNMK